MSNEASIHGLRSSGRRACSKLVDSLADDRRKFIAAFDERTGTTHSGFEEPLRALQLYLLLATAAARDYGPSEGQVLSWTSQALEFGKYGRIGDAARDAWDEFRDDQARLQEAFCLGLLPNFEQLPTEVQGWVRLRFEELRQNLQIALATAVNDLMLVHRATSESRSIQAAPD